LRFEKKVLAEGKNQEGKRSKVTFLELLSAGVALSKLRRLAAQLNYSVSKS
jgi:hypothetical protein